MLVVTGFPFDWPFFGQKTELIDLEGPNNICNLPDFPIQVYGAVGFNNVNGPTICGGVRPDAIVTKECFNLNSDRQWENLTNMTTTRAIASVTQIDSDEVLIIGGRQTYGTLKSTEIFSSSGLEASEDLPFTIRDHCTLKINATTALICGGTAERQLNSDATWFMDLFTFKISPGPRLQTGRNSHGCATLNLSDKKYGIITGGFQWKTNGTQGIHQYLNTTEILDLQDLQANYTVWKPGK